jgi:hypothetical protein
MADILSHFPLHCLLVALQRGEREPSFGGFFPSCVIDCRLYVLLFKYEIIIIIIIMGGRDSLDGIAVSYRLDGPGSIAGSPRFRSSQYP